MPKPKSILSDDEYRQLDNPIHWQSLTGVDMVCMFRWDDLQFTKDEKDRFKNFRVFAELQTLSLSSTRSVHAVRCLGESAARDYTRGARTFAGSLIFTMFNKDPFEDVLRLDTKNEAYSGREPFFIDQLPEFDIIITAINEMGLVSKALVGGITLTHYGTTLSIHDIYTEITYGYVAKWYIPMTEDIRAFDAIRKLQLEPLGKAASTLAYDVVEEEEDRAKQDARRLLGKYPSGKIHDLITEVM